MYGHYFLPLKHSDTCSWKSENTDSKLKQELIDKGYELINTFIKVKITDVKEYDLIGEIL